MIKIAKPTTEPPAEFKRLDDVLDWALGAMRKLRRESRHNGPSLEEQAFAPSGGPATPTK